MADRLGDLKMDFVDDDDNWGDEDPSVSDETAQHVAQYDSIKEGLDAIFKSVAEIDKLREKDRNIASEAKRKNLMSEVEQVMANTNRRGAEVKQQLDKLKKDNATFKKEHPGDIAQTQMRNNLYQTYVRRFHQVMNEYNTAAAEFKKNLQDRTRRQLKIVDRNISDEQIDKIVESGQASGIIKEALLSDNIQDVVKDIEERHMDILKLEHQVLEVHELFRDLATLVDIQQESLDVIQNRIEHAKAYAKHGEEEVRKAEKYQKKTRKRKICCLVVIMVILICILAPTIGAAVGDS